MKFTRLALTILCSLAAVAGTAPTAAAHAISIGFENAGPGAVTIWLGTYSTGHEAFGNEGSMMLEGVNGTVFGPQVELFDLLAGVGVGFKPDGLIDGVTNFFAPNTVGALVGSDVPYRTTGCPACGPIERWQGVTFSGLAAGEYQFTWIPAATPTQQWSPWNPNMNGVFDLSDVVVPPVPEPTAMVLLGASVLAGFLRNRVGRRN
ncbi:MAG TPA: PEP-CTERM sorting domain-containing protein [Luteitalea sp.]|nr:PEP-CTERM sorting domain-containing protein [Luteitalea sp.]